MIQAQKLATIAHKSLLELRLSKLRRGRPFMINSPELPAYQCYMEYADGTIKIEQIDNARTDFQEIRVLSVAEANQLRLSLGLKPFHA